MTVVARRISDMERLGGKRDPAIKKKKDRGSWGETPSYYGCQSTKDSRKVSITGKSDWQNSSNRDQGTGRTTQK